MFFVSDADDYLFLLNNWQPSLDFGGISKLLFLAVTKKKNTS